MHSCPSREVKIPMRLSESCMSVVQKCVWFPGLEILIQKCLNPAPLHVL